MAIDKDKVYLKEIVTKNWPTTGFEKFNTSKPGTIVWDTGSLIDVILNEMMAHLTSSRHLIARSFNPTLNGSKLSSERILIASLPLLQSFLIAKASEVVDDLTRETKIRIEEFVVMQRVPYSQNHYLFENISKLRSKCLLDEVMASLPKGDKVVSVNPESLASTVRNVFTRNQEKSVDKHMAEEMQHALSSYGKVAQKIHRYCSHDLH
ncbi:hypothetical protein ACHAW5_006621 [Stephanodiscus triporus]|uniref:Uncharacterized protein n=1 Tax=Stephanodiscus triporus TaxID=2934178 RepID=A0ABD3PJH4_9STRA